MKEKALNVLKAINRDGLENYMWDIAEAGARYCNYNNVDDGKEFKEDTLLVTDEGVAMTCLSEEDFDFVLRYDNEDPALATTWYAVEL